VNQLGNESPAERRSGSCRLSVNNWFRADITGGIPLQGAFSGTISPISQGSARSPTSIARLFGAGSQWPTSTSISAPGGDYPVRGVGLRRRLHKGQRTAVLRLRFRAPASVGQRGVVSSPLAPINGISPGRPMPVCLQGQPELHRRTGYRYLDSAPPLPAPARRSMVRAAPRLPVSNDLRRRTSGWRAPGPCCDVRLGSGPLIARADWFAHRLPILTARGFSRAVLFRPA